MSRTWAACVVGLVAVVGAGLAHAQPSGPPGAHEAAASSEAMASSEAEPVRAVLNRYCVACHNQRLQTAGLALDTMDAARVGDHPAAWEQVVRKLRTGAMPPVGRPRPDPAAYVAVASTLETALDRVAAADPEPGRTTVHRLNRREYANAVRDLLTLEVDAAALLPADNADLGFDNMADILSVSPALLDRYIFAARKISRLAVGDPGIEPTTETYALPSMRFQDRRMSEDLPFGSRGGIAIRHNFPLDGEYDVRIRLRRQLYDYVRGLQNRQQLEVRLDGERVAAFTIGGAPGTPPPRTFAGAVLGDRAWEEYALHADEDLEVRIAARAGPRVLGVSFVQGRSERDGVLQPRATGKVLAVAERWSSTSEAPEAAVDHVSIAGPFDATGPGETPSRERVFVCRPASASEEAACAREILSTLARRAWRRPVTAGTSTPCWVSTRRARRRRLRDRHSAEPREHPRRPRAPVPHRARAGRGGPRQHPSRQRPRARLAALVLPVEQHPRRRAPRRGRPRGAARSGRAAGSGAAHARRRPRPRPGRRVRPAVARPRHAAERRPHAGAVPGVGRQPAGVVPARDGAVRREPDPREPQRPRPRAGDYTFVDERLARHYGIPDVYGSRFRQVTFGDGVRGGLLGQGSILTVTSYPTRTSPVLRGHWLLDHLLGAPPPPPPPDVPDLPDRGEGGRPASVRERLEQHRENPVCAACHAPMDPLGFALEHFDAIGKWRATGEGGDPIDASGVFPDGTGFEGLAGLKAMLASRHEQFVQTVVEKLATYALGRGLEHYDMPAVRRIMREAAAGDYRWSDLVVGIVESTPFQMRRSES